MIKKISLKKGERMAERKVPASKRQIKNGSYSVALTAVVIAGAVAVNLIASELPSQYTKIDVSEQQLSSLTDQSKELLAGLEEDVTLYYIVQDSSRDTYVSHLLERYEGYSSHIKVKEIDPVVSPNFTTQYTEETLSDNSIIVTCGESNRVIAYSSMYESEFNYNYYSYETTGFDGEGQITSAIAAVSSQDLPKLYTLSGHGELEINTTYAQSIEKENIETETLNLVTADGVPEDADCLLIASPTSDFSDAETQKILAYLRTGGKAIIITDYTDIEMPNLTSILDYYGVSLVDGVVLEKDSNYYIQLPYYLVPEINSTDISSDMTGGSGYTFLAAAQGIQTTEAARDTLSITSVLTTSDSSYSKTDVAGMTTYEKEEGDVDGPFDVGVIVTETVELTEELLEEVNGAVESAGSAEGLGTLELAEAESDAQESVGGSEGQENVGVSESEESAGSPEGQAQLETNAAEKTEASDEAETGAEAEEAEAETGAETEEAETEAEEVVTAETKLAVFSSSAIMDASADQMVSGGNSKLFMNALSWMCGHTTTVSVPVKSLSIEYLTVTTAGSNFWSILVIGIIPAAFLITGLIIWLKRRKQ